MNARSPILLSRPDFDDRELEAVERVIRSGWIMQGEEVARFEAEFARHVGAPFACAVSSGTAALHLALLAAGIGSGDEVITVSFSFIATANSVRLSGAVPVFCDIDPTDNNMAVEAIEGLLTPATRAILCVHQMGVPCDLERLLAICRRHRLLLIEDAACAIGASIRRDGEWEAIGRPHGDFACFSFHPRKIVTTGEGGMVVSGSEDTDRKVRRLRQHGLDDFSGGPGDFQAAGFNYRLTDLQAAIGRVQLEKLPEMLERRRLQAARYDRLLADAPGIVLPTISASVKSNRQSYWIRLESGLEAKDAAAALEKVGIAARIAARCAHLTPAYATFPGSCRHGDLSHSVKAERTCLVLPLHHDLDEADQERVADAVRRLSRDRPA